MFSLQRVPFWIVVLLLLDVALIAAPVIDYWLGSPFSRLTLLIHLDRENSLQSWYSSMQWFCAGILFGTLVVHLIRNQPAGLWAMAGLSLLFFVFSVDEITGVHEWVGQKSDALLPGGDRGNTALWRTGIWPLLIGIPVLALLALSVVRIRRLFLPHSRQAFALLIAGLTIMFTGALVVELGANLIEVRPGNRGLILLQLVCEEFLEMLGVSLVVWSAYELLRAYGFELRVPENAARPAFEPRSPVNRALGESGAVT